jgi:hypothetical protein
MRAILPEEDQRRRGAAGNVMVTTVDAVCDDGAPVFAGFIMFVVTGSAKGRAARAASSYPSLSTVSQRMRNRSRRVVADEPPTWISYWNCRAVRRECRRRRRSGHDDRCEQRKHHAADHQPPDPPQAPAT